MSTPFTFAAHSAVNVNRVGPARSRRVAAALTLLLVAVVLGLPSTASAHPLGNFSVNHITTVRISNDRVELRYLLDQAEIPTVQERGLSRGELLRRKADEITRGLELIVDGRTATLGLDGPGRVTFPEGSGGLPTSRFEFELSARVEAPRRVELSDDSFDGRVGWRAIVAAPGEGTAVRTDTPSGDPTNGLSRYPEDLLSSPPDRREATFRVEPGDGTLLAPRSEGGEAVTAEAGDAAAAPAEAGPGSRGDGFTALFERAAAGEGVLALLLIAALGWGALHALSPGHGKAMVAAYLVGTQGRPRHAVALGATVTVTHTIGVFALGLVTLALSQYVLPEDLYPWLNLASGLLVVAIGAGVLRARLRAKRKPEAHSHPHPHSHGHPHPHPHGHHHDVTTRGLLGMGAAAGLIPCPSALVVLLAAVSQHEVGLGMLLIVAFSLGLAGTLTALGLAVVYARRLPAPRRLLTSRAAAALPAASAALIVAVGCVLTVNAVPEVLL